jgi:hypothetical protein
MFFDLIEHQARVDDNGLDAPSAFLDGGAIGLSKP